MGKSLEELEEQAEVVAAQAKIEEQEALIREMKQRYGKDGWKMASSNGTKGGIDWDAVKMRL